MCRQRPILKGLIPNFKGFSLELGSPRV